MIEPPESGPLLVPDRVQAERDLVGTQDAVAMHEEHLALAFVHDHMIRRGHGGGGALHDAGFGCIDGIGEGRAGQGEQRNERCQETPERLHFPIKQALAKADQIIGAPRVAGDVRGFCFWKVPVNASLICRRFAAVDGSHR